MRFYVGTYGRVYVPGRWWRAIKFLVRWTLIVVFAVALWHQLNSPALPY